MPLSAAQPEQQPQMQMARPSFEALPYKSTSANSTPTRQLFAAVQRAAAANSAPLDEQLASTTASNSSRSDSSFEQRAPVADFKANTFPNMSTSDAAHSEAIGGSSAALLLGAHEAAASATGSCDDSSGVQSLLGGCGGAVASSLNSSCVSSRAASAQLSSTSGSGAMPSSTSLNTGFGAGVHSATAVRGGYDQLAHEYDDEPTSSSAGGSAERRPLIGGRRPELQSVPEQRK